MSVPTPKQIRNAARAGLKFLVQYIARQRVRKLFSPANESHRRECSERGGGTGDPLRVGVYAFPEGGAEAASAGADCCVLTRTPSANVRRTVKFRFNCRDAWDSVMSSMRARF